MTNMYLEPDQKYRIKVTLENYLQDTVASECEIFLQNNLNFLHHLTCSAVGTVIEVIFNPPNEITDDFLFEKILDTLRNAGISYVNTILSIYAGNNKRTLVGAAIGALLGSRFGLPGAAVGGAAGAGLSKLLDWKNLCECADDGFGHFTIRYF